MLLDILTLPVNFVQDSTVSVSHNDHGKTDEEEDANAVEDDDLFLVFWRVFVHDTFAHIGPLELNKHYEQRYEPDGGDDLENAFLGHPCHVPQGVNNTNVAICCHGQNVQDCGGRREPHDHHGCCANFGFLDDVTAEK